MQMSSAFGGPFLLSLADWWIEGSRRVVMA